MNRDIKFRGLDVNGTWHYGLPCITKEGYFISNKAGMPQAFKIRPETLSEYAGVPDKNGKEVYEGDIITDGNKYQVIFHRGAFVGAHTVYDVGWTRLLDKGDFEIIGNIHENPKKLEVKP